MADFELINLLNKVKTGELSVEEACREMDFLEAGNEHEANDSAPSTSSHSTRPSPGSAEYDITPPSLGWWQHAWLVPVGIGVVLVVLSASLLSWGYMNERFFWFYCSWLPLLLGLLVLTLGVWSRQARWAHVRIRSADGTRISVSTPLPARFAGWVLRFMSPRIPALKENHLDALPVILDALESSDEPIFVDVDDEDGDQVRVYIV